VTSDVRQAAPQSISCRGSGQSKFLLRINSYSVTLPILGAPTPVGFLSNVGSHSDLKAATCLSQTFSIPAVENSMREETAIPPGLATFLATATIISAILFAFVLRATGGIFGFTLDDPYIGLAFASHILDGHFGLNLNEAVDPSSSIIFPFLLVAILKLGGGQVTVFLFDLSFVAVTIFILVDLIHDAGIDLSQMPTWRVVIAVVALLLGLNLIAIVFTGLEHPLHIADTLACLLGIVRTTRTGRMPRWLPIALILNPLIRFEGLSIWGAGVIVLWKQHRVASLLTFAAGLILVGSYSFYLHHLGLPLLPGSVLQKSTIASSNGISGALVHVASNFLQNLRQYGAAQLLAMLALLTAAFVRDSHARGIALFAALPILAHLAAGAFGWFGRYEIYVLTLGGAAVLVLYADFFSRWLAGGTLAFAAGILIWLVIQIDYVLTAFLTPTAASEVYLQQFQMHRFAVEFWQKPIAVNDLGWVAYGNPNYVLDLDGLGSEAVRVARANAGPDNAWVGRLVQQHQIGLAMIYTSWFQTRPADWVEVATLSLDHSNVVARDRTVTFFATTRVARDELEDMLRRFAPTLPSGVTLTRNVHDALATSGPMDGDLVTADH
jgi:hypothetical protein